jgi:hypothetical protein
MSRIEKAMEKAAQLRNFPGGGEVAIEGDKKTSPQPIRQHSPPPPMDSDEIKTQIQNPLLATLCDPHSPVSEEYRKLKLAIISFTQRDGFKNVIMVTSSVSCEGKSIVSLNLAISLAQEYDLTVLLVDADLRKPSIHDYLGISPEKGLSDYLAGEASLSDLLIKTGEYYPCWDPAQKSCRAFFIPEDERVHLGNKEPLPRPYYYHRHSSCSPVCRITLIDGYGGRCVVCCQRGSCDPGKYQRGNPHIGQLKADWRRV